MYSDWVRSLAGFGFERNDRISCQSYLKNRGDLLLVDWVRLEESLGGRVFMPSSPGVGRKDLGASAIRIPPTWGKRRILLGME